MGSCESRRRQNDARWEETTSAKYLNIQITRDRLIDNAAFADLKYFVRLGIDFYASRSFIKDAASVEVLELETVKHEIDSLFKRYRRFLEGESVAGVIKGDFQPDRWSRPPDLGLRPQGHLGRWRMGIGP